MGQPKVSVIVPVYNSEKYLERCLKSLKEQTLRDIEIILVDDGSPDRSPEMCDFAAMNDERIKVIHKSNKGLGMARNSGIEAAHGKYIAFVDSDDYVKNDMLETLFGAAENYGAQFVMSGISFVGGNMFGKDNEYEETVYFDRNTVFEGEHDVKKLMLGIFGALPDEPRDSRYGMSVCTNLYLKETVTESGVRFLSEREVLSEDVLFTLDFLPHIKRAVGVRGVFYRYCRNGGSVSKSYSGEKFLKSLVLLDEIEKRISKAVPYSEYKIYLDRMTQGLARVLCSQEIMHASDCGLKWCDLKRRLELICTADRIAGALKHYPWYRLPKKQAIFAFAVKRKLYLLQKLLVTLRDK